jgi:urea carboxylase
VGFWDIGLPPSGPIDDFAFRIANRLLGNDSSAAALEATILGPTLQFHCNTAIVLTGAPTIATLDEEPMPFWKAVNVKQGTKGVLY